MRVVVVGAGYAGLTAACHLAKAGHEVVVLEKANEAGGRNRQFVVDGFTFESGPSWLWMKDVHEAFYKAMDRRMEDYVELEMLTPAYRLFFEDEHVDVPNGVSAFAEMLERFEPGCTPNFRKRMALDQWRYAQAMDTYLKLPSLHIGEYTRLDLLASLPWIGLFTSQKDAIARDFKDTRVRRLLEWPTIFVGHSPSSVPTLYGLLNWSAIADGTWFPKNGMYDTIRGMVAVANELGVTFKYEHEVRRVAMRDGRIEAAVVDGKRFVADRFVVTCDMAYFERNVVPEPLRMYDPEYWDAREVSPSCLLFYLGVDRKVPNLQHHNLFFDADMYEHMDTIYGQTRRLPERPLFYVSQCSNTNPAFAPEGCDALFLLVPMPSLPVTRTEKDRIFDHVLARLALRVGVPSLSSHVVVRREFDYADFCKTFHSLSGNGFGLSNTLWQSAFLKPSMRSTSIDNLFYAGQTTVPGGGVPTAMLSGALAASLVDAPTPRLPQRVLMRGTQFLRSKL